MIINNPAEWGAREENEASAKPEEKTFLFVSLDTSDRWSSFNKLKLIFFA
jgi:hypothetical protein